MERKEINKRLGLTEIEMDELAREYETDAWDATSFKKAPVGRPSLSDDETKTLTLKIPVSTLHEVENRASHLGVTRSEYLRGLINEDLCASVSVTLNKSKA